eukprot:COSAG02_NODE_1826_length_10754_cov_4.509714_3_plen_60_part_00
MSALVSSGTPLTSGDGSRPKVRLLLPEANALGDIAGLIETVSFAAVELPMPETSALLPW